MTIVRPRLNDYYGLSFSQADVNFAIPFVDEDIPLYLDPFLLWKSPSQQDNALHANLVDSFNYLGMLYQNDSDAAILNLKELSECSEVGLGTSKSKQGKRIGDGLAIEVLNTFSEIPQLKSQGYTHFEEIQLLVGNFSKDRISDIACNLIKSYLIDYTIQMCRDWTIPVSKVELTYFDTRKHTFVAESASVPVHPSTGEPILLVPTRWLRFTPWLNVDDYFTNYISTSDRILNGQPIPRVEILNYNRSNYDAVQAYTLTKQNDAGACKNDPLFSQIPVLSTKRKLNLIRKLQTGKGGNADRIYEDQISPMLASMLYPELDFADVQERTVSGVLIRDLVFYNNTSHPFLKDLFETYDSKQLIFELKNVAKVERDHINQLNRYMTDTFGRFGVMFTRNKVPTNIFKNTVDLWAGQRRCIIVMDDSDLELMCGLYQSKQRRPIDVIKRKYSEFMRACPS